MLTAAGRGAVAVLQLTMESPQQAGLLFQQHFRSRSGIAPDAAATDRILYGDWHQEDIVLVRTADAVWEIHCHGGTATVAAILADLRNSLAPEGAVDPALQGFSDRLEAQHLTVESEIRRLLLQAGTRRAARHLLAQSGDRLASALRRIAELTAAPQRHAELELILQWQGFAKHLTAPWQVLVLGRPNAGKSSLVNALVGFDRSIVYDQPGTTRDVVEAGTVLDDWSFLFLDTAGIRIQTSDPIEQLGIAAAHDAVSRCDACLLVVDAPQLQSADELLPPGMNAISLPVAVVLNKTDLMADDIDPHLAGLHSRLAAVGRDRCPVIPASMVTGDGRERICQWLLQTLIPHTPPVETPLPLPGKICDTLAALRDAPQDPQQITLLLHELQRLARPGQDW